MGSLDFAVGEQLFSEQALGRGSYICRWTCDRHDWVEICPVFMESFAWLTATRMQR